MSESGVCHYREFGGVHQALIRGDQCQPKDERCCGEKAIGGILMRERQLPTGDGNVMREGASRLGSASTMASTHS